MGLLELICYCTGTYWHPYTKLFFGLNSVRASIGPVA